MSGRRVGGVWSAIIVGAAFAGAALEVGVSLAEARPGGGHSYRGSSSRSSSFGGSSFGGSSRSSSSSWGSSSRSSFGSSSSSSSSGSYSGGPVGPLVFIGFGVFCLSSVVMYAFHSVANDWSSGDRTPVDYETHFQNMKRFSTARPKKRRGPVDAFARLREKDPQFSAIILEDFLYELYTRAIEARSDSAAMRQLRPYLSPEVRLALPHRGNRMVHEIEGVVVGSMKISRVRSLPDFAYITVDFESNYTEVYQASGAGKDRAGRLGFYSHERWSLVRRQGVQSRKPDDVRALNCPSCGAPVEHSEHDVCTYCNTRHGTADFDWFVEKIEVVREETRGPTLTGYAEEVGTDDRTVVDAHRAAGLKALKGRDPEFSIKRLRSRVHRIYRELNSAWTSQQWDDARPYLSDRLWNSMRYWIVAYTAQRLQNVMLSAKPGRVELVKVRSDPFFDSLTVRVFASAIDQTIHLDSGAIVGGSEQPREYSEYWTLIRSVTRGTAAEDSAGKQCPSCGAALAINMAGNCESCGVKVTGGAFDWVLSKIEQDESYRG